MGDWTDWSAHVAILATDAERSRELFEAGVRAASALDGRDLVPERIDPSRASTLASDDALDLIENAAALVVDLGGLPAGAFALVSWLARARGRAVVLARPATVALPFEVRDLEVRVVDAATEGGAPRARRDVALFATEAAAARARLSPVDAALSAPRTARNLRRRRAADGVADAIRKADRALLAGSVSRALGAIAQARLIEPDAPDLLVREGVLLRDAGRHDDAAARLSRAVALAPACAPAWRELGLARDVAGDAGAEDALARAVSLDPDYASLVACAQVVERAGRPDDALHLFERALEASDGQLNLVLPTLVLRVAKDGCVFLSDAQRERVAQVLSIRARQADSDPSVDSPWSHFDAATARWLLGDPAQALETVRAAAGLLSAPWQAETFARTLDALERAAIDVAPARAALGLVKRRQAADAEKAAKPAGRPFRAEVRDAAWARANVPCASACPVGTDAGSYVTLIARGRFDEAYRVARGPNPFASVCGRVCAAPCEEGCRRGAIDAPVAIRALKRFLTERHGPESADSRLGDVLDGTPALGMEGPAYASHLRRLGSAGAAAAPSGPRRVAVVGGGPAGLACAHDLQFLGHRVTVFEASDALGGMMRHGIPTFRLPRAVLDAEIRAILDLGVEVQMNAPLGAHHTVEDLFNEGFDAVFLGSGAGRGRDLEVEGSELDGVVRAIDYLINVNNGYKMGIGPRVVVVGGGNVAMDVARTLRRTGRVERTRAAAAGRTIAPALEGAALYAAVEGAGAEVHVVARQPMGHWPAQRGVHGREEVEEARGEGVIFHPLRGVRRIVGEAGRVVAVELAEVVRLTDETGRYAPLYGAHAAETLACDAVLLAVGQEPDLDYLAGTKDLERTRDGLIRVDRETLATSRPGVYAGGDVAYGPRTLIEAVSEGKRAAASIHAHLSGGASLLMRHVYTEVSPRSIAADPRYDSIPRVEPPKTAVDRSTGIGEVESVYDEAEAKRQASRCLSCHVQTVYDGSMCIACGRCVDVCPNSCLALVPAGAVDVVGLSSAAVAAAETDAPVSLMVKDETACIRCGLCAERCPTGAMTMERYELMAADAAPADAVPADERPAALAEAAT